MTHINRRYFLKLFPMKNANIDISVIENTKTLPDSVIQDIHTISQDIWARKSSLWELCQCTRCAKIYSAEDIFPEEALETDLIQTLIQRKYDGVIPCLDSECQSPTRYIFWPSHIADLQARYRDSVQAFLVLCHEKETGRLVGFEDGYIDTLDTIVTREFQHYNPNSPISENPLNTEWIQNIWKHVNEILWYSPEKILVLSSMAILPEYQNPYTLFNVLKQFAEILPEDYTLPWITEVDRRNVTYKLTTSTWWKILPVQANPERLQVEYESELIVHNSVSWAYKSYCTMKPREFVRILLR